jgi:hypothetical protein
MRAEILPDHHNRLSTLQKLRCLEAYVASDSMAADAVLDSSLSKLLLREQMRMQRLAQRLRLELQQFEAAHKLLSEEFYARYSRGEMGDAMDFIEWAATVEMLADAERRMMLLSAAQ